jgi:ferredoxin
MDVTFTGSWYDETAEKEAANKLMDNDCVLISQHADSMGAPTACESRGVPNVSYNGSTKSVGPNTYIISSRIDWTPYFVHAIECVQNGDAIEADYTGTIETESVLLTEKANHILDYERATHIIEEADFIGVGTCFCRHKNFHLGKPCRLNAPMETCLTFGNVARSLAEHGGYTRPIDKSEAKEILEMSYSYNLVQMGENVREHPAFMCNCCGCCCEALEAVRRFSPMQPIATTNYIPRINQDDCVSCGKCERVCPVLAVSMEEAGPSEAGSGKKRPVIDETICLGCGVCARNCPKKAIILQRRPIKVITPVNSTHRFVLQAIEKGTLQNLIFDNQAFANHRALAAVLGTILRLPPLKQALASRQFKSVYLDHLLSAQRKEKQ